MACVELGLFDYYSHGVSLLTESKQVRDVNGEGVVQAHERDLRSHQVPCGSKLAHGCVPQPTFSDMENALTSRGQLLLHTNTPSTFRQTLVVTRMVLTAKSQEQQGTRCIFSFCVLSHACIFFSIDVMH